MAQRIQLSEAISELREELRAAVEKGKHQDIVFTATNVELELSVTFGIEAKVGGGFKLLTFLDLSAETKASDQQAHKVKLQFTVSDRQGKPIEVQDDEKPKK
jgi:hypothetical protein